MRGLILPRSCDGRLERQLGELLGRECVDLLREQSADYYAPMPVHGTPAWVHKGEFYPRATGGGFSGYEDWLASYEGKKQVFPFAKTATAGVVNRGSTLWTLGANPPVGLVPTGLSDAALTRATLGALGQQNPPSPETLHIAKITAGANAVPQILVLYDRLWHGRPSVLVNTLQSFTTAPNRQTGTDSKGNICFIEVETVLPATAHNWTVNYIDDAGNGAEDAPVITGVASAAANTFDMAALWFMPLNAGDTGIREIEAITLSVALASGAVTVVLGHPIAFIPITEGNIPQVKDGLISAFNMHRILDDACLSFFFIVGNNGAAAFNGQVEMVAG